MLTHRSDRAITDGSLELDERMGLIMWVGGAGLAVCTKIGIVANSALVAISLDVGLVTIVLVAERSIAVDTVVARLACVWSNNQGDIVERLINRDESVATVDERCIWHASRAEIPVWAVETLVADAIDVLVTTIADSVVSFVAAWCQKDLRSFIKLYIFDCSDEGMAWVVTMLLCTMARKAKVIVLASSAGDEILFG